MGWSIPWHQAVLSTEVSTHGALCSGARWASGEPPDQWNVDAYLTFDLTIEGCTLTDFESMILYVGNDIIDSFERDWD